LALLRELETRPECDIIRKELIGDWCHEGGQSVKLGDVSDVEETPEEQTDRGRWRRSGEFLACALGIATIVTLYFFAGMIMLPLTAIVALVLIFRRDDGAPPETTSYPDDERPVCPHCLAENLWWTTFCTECGAPLSGYAPIGPLERVYTFGWFLRRAMHGTPLLIGFIGMWLWFGHEILLLPVFFRSLRHPGLSLANIGLFVLIYGIPIAILTRFTWHYFRAPVPKPSAAEDAADDQADVSSGMSTDIQEPGEKA
jgi:hypothetical protein